MHESNIERYAYILNTYSKKRVCNYSARTYADLCIAVLGVRRCSDTQRPAVLWGGVCTCPQPILCSSSARDGARAPGAPAAQPPIDCKEMRTSLHNGRGMKVFLELFHKKWSHLLGQWWVLQAWVDEAEFGHGLPLYCGAGLVHVRVRDWEPPPHVTEHVVQDPQVAHWPSTVTYNKR